MVYLLICAGLGSFILISCSFVLFQTDLCWSRTSSDGFMQFGGGLDYFALLQTDLSGFRASPDGCIWISAGLDCFMIVNGGFKLV